MEWSEAIQGVSGLWFKTGIDSSLKQHLLISDNENGVNGGSHDHYWKNSDGSYGVQLRDTTGMATTIDNKGHIFEHNTNFPSMTNEHLDNLFEQCFEQTLDNDQSL